MKLIKQISSGRLWENNEKLRSVWWDVRNCNAGVMVAVLTVCNEIYVHTWGIYTQQEPYVNMGTDPCQVQTTTQ
jgi:hypothetical protein